MPDQDAMIGSPHSYTDGDGVPWTVREFRTDGIAGNGATRPCLVFDCDTAFRLVREFPSDWRSLGPEQLSKLSWGR